MNIAIILASGNGQRMCLNDLPKQFIEIENKPIILYTIEKFLACNQIDKIIVTLPEQKWIDWIKKHPLYKNDDRILFIVGGKTRNDSLLKAREVLGQFNLNENDNIITHDGVRMFVDSEIEKNLEELKRNEIVGTYFPTYDSIAVSNEGNFVDDVLDRTTIFLAQTPQSFKYKYFNKLTSNTDTTDLISWLFLKNKEKVKMVIGSQTNFKITTEFDLFHAQSIIKNSKKW